jgi:methionyl-tRNA formyltransferase
MKILIANTNPIHQSLLTRCETELNAKIIESAEGLNVAFLESFRPDFVFFPHWSHIIPESIWSKYTCIVFHMTDLPFGRGGSPLQNLIVSGHEDTMITAIKVQKGIDTGDIYCKEKLSLLGTAEEIFLRTGEIIFTMIKKIVDLQLTPTPQEGMPLLFKRRTPAESDIADLTSLREVYDYIRMLDADGYPPAFLETKNFRFEFKRASLKKDSIIADVRIFKK